jgi:hypothetical protein
MLFKYSYYSKKTEEEIHKLVGRSIRFIDRIKMDGIGSQRLMVQEADSEITALISEHNGPSYTNIELRPKGIIIAFRIKLDNWVLVLPYHKLSVFKNAKELILHQDNWKLKLTPVNNAGLDLKFFQKLLKLKAEVTSSI